MVEKETVTNLEAKQSTHSISREERSRLALLVCIPVLTLFLLVVLVIILLLRK